MKNLATLFKALSDETRLALLALLLERGELCVCDLEQALGIGQSKTSRHLRSLTHAGLVEHRRKGLWIYYRVARRLGPQPRAVLSLLRRVLADGDREALTARLDEWLARKQAGGSCGQRAGRVPGEKRT